MYSREGLAGSGREGRNEPAGGGHGGHCRHPDPVQRQNDVSIAHALPSVTTRCRLYNYYWCADMGITSKINISKKRISAFCRKNHIKRLSLFGSVLGDSFGEESDVDVLVEFKPGQIVGLLRMAALERELAAIIDRKIDLRTPADLSRYFRDEVLSSALEQYAEG